MFSFDVLRVVSVPPFIAPVTSCLLSVLFLRLLLQRAITFTETRDHITTPELHALLRGWPL